MKRLFICLFIFLCNGELSAQKTDAFKWMTGTWKINTGKGQVVEVWKIDNDSTLAGKSFFVAENKDTIPQETVELAYRNGEWYYIPTVVGQNNNQPTRFKIIFYKGTEFISENPSHDFPQRVSYRRIKQQLFASIEGKEKGKYKKLNYDFVSE